MTTVAGGFSPLSGACTACPGADFAGAAPRKKIAAPPPSRIPNKRIKTYFMFSHLYRVALGLATGDIVGDTVGDGGGGALFMLDNNVLSTAAIVFATASTCARTCASGTLLKFVGTSKRLGSGFVWMLRISATIVAPLTP